METHGNQQRFLQTEFGLVSHTVAESLLLLQVAANITAQLLQM
jgi:hypothetical protein